MIGYLKGAVIREDIKSVVVLVGSLGYKVFTNSPVKKNESVEFWTYLAVRENALDLYGFRNKEELDFFELLITVSGIGPKSALAILSVATLPNLRHAISTGDTTHLVKVSGVGKKSAEKIVLELKDKIEGGNVNMHEGDILALDALKSLGYGEREARDALKKVEGKDAEEKIKKAIKLLS
jgi:Holliday junction DNA helicase RuvA